MQSDKLSVRKSLSFSFKTLSTHLDTYGLATVIWTSVASVALLIASFFDIQFFKIVGPVAQRIKKLLTFDAKPSKLLIYLIYSPLSRHGFWLSITGIVFFVLMTFFSLVFQRMALDYCDAGTSSVRRFITTLWYFPKVLVASLIYWVLVMFGFALFIAPGVFLIARLRFFTYILLEKKVGIIEAFKQSMQLTAGHTNKLVIFSLSLLLFYRLAFSFIFTALLMMPLEALIYAHMYRSLQK